MAKIIDVAKLAGVSAASVSRYLNNKSMLRDETAEKIEAAIKELGYSPNPIAAGLRTKRSNMIAFIIPTLNNLYYIELLREMEHLCSKNGYTLSIYSIEEDMNTLKKILMNISEYQYDGVIICYLDEPEMLKTLNRLQENLPIVLITAAQDRDAFNNVFLDVRDATYQAVKTLIKKDRRRIGFIGGGFKDMVRVIIKEKFLGYEAAVKDSGLPLLASTPKGQLASEVADGMTAGIVGAQELMNRYERPDAIICSIDIVAMGCVRYLKENGYRVPDDVEVVGFSGSMLTNVYNSDISTITQPLGDMARAAFYLLIQQIKDPVKEKKCRIFRARLHIN